MFRHQPWIIYLFHFLGLQFIYFNKINLSLYMGLVIGTPKLICVFIFTKQGRVSG